MSGKGKRERGIIIIELRGSGLQNTAHKLALWLPVRAMYSKLTLIVFPRPHVGWAQGWAISYGQCVVNTQTLEPSLTLSPKNILL